MGPAKLVGSAACAFAAFAITAGGQVTPPAGDASPWRVAQRFDDGRVVIMVSGEDAALTTDEREAVGPSLAKPAPLFLATLLDGVRRLPVEVGRRLTKTSASVGDRWAIDAGRAGWFNTSVDDLVLVGGGCSEFGAAMASVDATERDAFGRVKEKYFAARPLTDWSPKSGPANAGPAAFTMSESDRQAIARLLQREFQRAAPGLLKALTGDHTPKPDFWRDTYARVDAGAATLRFDQQAFRVTPDGSPRLFVRAVWNLDGQTVFLLGAWLRTSPSFDVESVDLHAAKFPWFGVFKYDGPLEPKMNGQVLNVTDVDRDGVAEVVMLYHYYEGALVEVVTYPPHEPSGRSVLARFGVGC